MDAAKDASGILYSRYQNKIAVNCDTEQLKIRFVVANLKGGKLHAFWDGTEVRNKRPGKDGSTTKFPVEETTEKITSRIRAKPEYPEGHVFTLEFRPFPGQ